MTSAVALATFSKEQPLPKEASDGGWTSEQSSSDELTSTTCTASFKKRPPPAIISNLPPQKKIKRTSVAVQRTHSPKTVPSPLAFPVKSSIRFHLEKITPTVRGIKEVARHLKQQEDSSSTSLSTPTISKPHPLLALPTECSYELLTLIDWSKKETPSEESLSFRTDRLNQLQLASSPSPANKSPVHVYLPHNDIGQLDHILEFPRKGYALKENPKAFSAFHEGRLIFQRLADKFWPGPVLIYLAVTNTQSSIPAPLLQKQETLSSHNYIGFRCPSHPLTVKVVRQIRRSKKSAEKQPLVMVGSCIAKQEEPDELFGQPLLYHAKDVAHQFAQMPTTTTTLADVVVDDQPQPPNQSSIQILHGEEKREIFSVPTCQFQDEWLECWIVQETRTVVLKGKSQRVLPELQHLLRAAAPAAKNNRVVQSVLCQWKVVDQREKED